jgi:hypothetical protein
MTRRRLVAVVAAAAGLAGFAWSERSKRELRSAARSLVPPGARVVDEVEGDCVELARSPSCVHIYFTQDGTPVEARTESLRALARETGWTEVDAEVLPGGNDLRFERRRLKAFVSLRRDDMSTAPAEGPERERADVVMVERN